MLCHCFSSFLANSLTLPPALEGGGTSPKAGGLEDTAEDLGSMAPRGLSGTLTGGIKGRFEGVFWRSLPCCCGALTGLTLAVGNSCFDCVFMVTDVCFLPGGIMGSLGADEGAEGRTEGGVGASLTGEVRGGFLFPWMGTPCPVFSRRASVWYAIR